MRLIYLYLIISLFSLVNCDGGTQHTPVHDQTQEEQKSNTSVLFARLKASQPAQYAQVIKDALSSLDAAAKKDVTSQVDDEGNTLAHYLVQGPIEVSLLKELCDNAPKNCSLANKNGEVSFEVAAKNPENLSKNILEIYFAHNTAGLKLKNGDSIIKPLILAHNTIVTRDESIVFLLTKEDSRLYKSIVDLLVSDNLTHITSKIFSDLEAEKQRNYMFNSLYFDLGYGIVQAFQKLSDVQQLNQRSDFINYLVLGQRITSKINPSDSASADTAQYDPLDGALPLITDTYKLAKNLADMAKPNASFYNEIIVPALNEFQSGLKSFKALSAHLEASRLDAIAKANPSDPNAQKDAQDAKDQADKSTTSAKTNAQQNTKPSTNTSSTQSNKGEKQLIVWTSGFQSQIAWFVNEFKDYYLSKDFINNIHETAPEYPVKSELEHALEIIKKASKYYTQYFKKIYSAETLQAIPNGQVTENSLVFLNMKKAGWHNAIVGEVKYVNGTRYQFVGMHIGDTYGVIAASKAFRDLYQGGFLTQRDYHLNLEKPWADSNETLLSTGGEGTATKVKYQGRAFVIKRNTFKPTAEVDAYEDLFGVDGVGPYFGSLGNEIFLEEGEPMETLVLTHKNVDLFIEPLLHSLSQIHAKGYFHNDIKVNNIIVFNSKPYFIDFGNQSTESRGKVGKWGPGITYPYYVFGEEFGTKKADIRALGFAFFAMRHINNDIHKTKFFEKDKGKVILKSDIKPDILAGELQTGDKIDQMIAKMLKQEFNDASEALTFMK